MPLETDQFEMQLDTVYELDRFADHYRFWNPSLFVLTGSVDVYTQEGAEPTDENDMFLEHEDLSGHNAFDTIPKYILIKENTATVANIVITGIKPTAV
jgi:hypothetical protein